MSIINYSVILNIWGICFCTGGNKDPLATPVALFETLIDKTSPPLKVGRTGFVISTETDALFLKMSTENGI